MRNFTLTREMTLSIKSFGSFSKEGGVKINFEMNSKPASRTLIDESDAFAKILAFNAS